MELDVKKLSTADRYKLLIGGIVPRPIALVSTIAADGSPNLAPFSFFAGVCSEPMTLLFCPANKPDGSMKDTLRNVLPAGHSDLPANAIGKNPAQGEFVVNIVPKAIARRMAACAEELEYGMSEFEISGLTRQPAVAVRPERVQESPISFECRTREVIRLAPGVGSAGNIVIGSVLHVHVDDAIINAKLHIDPALLDAVGRMGGLSYCTTRDRFEMPMGRAALDGIL